MQGDCHFLYTSITAGKTYNRAPLVLAVLPSQMSREQWYVFTREPLKKFGGLAISLKAFICHWWYFPLYDRTLGQNFIIRFFSRVPCMIFDFGPRPLNPVMTEHNLWGPQFVNSHFFHLLYGSDLYVFWRINERNEKLKNGKMEETSSSSTWCIQFSIITTYE